MNATLPRFLKSVYRKEPLPSFLITIGVVNGIIGGLDGQWVLFSLGLGTVGVAIALRWLLAQQRQPEPPAPVVQRYLPPHSSRPPLPIIAPPKKSSSR